MNDYAIPDEILDSLQTPFLAVFLDKVRENRDRVLRCMDGDPGRWRPHLKTTKLPVVWRELLAGGLRSFKCATTREAGCLLACARSAGVEEVDLLLAYPLTAPGLDRLGRLARDHPRARLSLAWEEETGMDRVPREVGIWADLNGGMDRTGIPLAEGERIAALCRAAGERLRGLHLYEGHITGGDPASRRARCHACYEGLLAARDALAAAGIAPGAIVTSGTPAFLHALAFAGFADLPHQVSPGTVLFHDARSREELPELDLVPAALLISRVVSRPAPGLVTLDAGSKSLSAEIAGSSGVPLDRPGLEPLSPSEEHLPMRVAAGDPPAVGEVVRLLPRHICTTVNLADEAVIMEKGRFLGVVPVAARGHEALG